MDNTRLFLFIALSFIGLMLWDAWQRDYHTPATVETADDLTVNRSTDTAPPVAAAPSNADFTDKPSVQDPTNLNIAPINNDQDAGTVNVETDVLRVKIDLRGGGISYAALKAYPKESDAPDVPFELLDNNQERLFVYQNGLTGKGTTPDHHALYSATKTEYTLGESDDSLSVALSWKNDAGLNVEKTYRFKRNSYLIDIDYSVKNHADVAWQGRSYEQLQRAKPSSGRTLLYTFTGAALSTPEQRYEKYDYDDLKDTPINTDVANGWVAILEHYFVSALVPVTDKAYHYYSKILDEKRYIIGFYSQPQSIESGATGNFTSRIFIGPKKQELLAQVAPSLELTVDYGVLWFIGKPLFQTLQFIHNITGNWGWAIILVTILLKLIFYPLSAAGYRSMAKMRKVQPRMMSIKERHEGDRARMNQAMMELYKTEKINPLGGCLPIIVQIPVFIALYWVLLESVELRQVPFTLWLKDLTAKDPYFVLPLLMGISMWIQQKLNPAPMDPVQQKVMQILPFVFTVFFAFFPAGLVLYWVVNNVLSIIQQWRITKVIEQEK